MLDSVFGKHFARKEDIENCLTMLDGAMDDKHFARKEDIGNCLYIVVLMILSRRIYRFFLVAVSY